MRFTHSAFYLLGTWGVDITRAVQVHNEMISAGRGTEYEAKIACAPLGNYDPQGNWHSLGLSPLEVMDRLQDGEYAELSAVTWAEYKKKLGLVSLPTTGQPTTDPLTKTDGSSSGPSEPDPVQPVSDLAA